MRIMIASAVEDRPKASQHGWRSLHRTGYGDCNPHRDRRRSSLKKGREFPAWLGIVPGEHTPGDQQKLP
jgi:hypothetical protein